MEQVEPEVPKPRALSGESVALQEAEVKVGTFIYFRRFFREGDALRRDEAGEIESDFVVLPLASDRQAVGRHPQCDVVVGWDLAVSRSHAEITKVGGDWYIEDLGSENGTAVNGSRVGRTRLVDGDQVRVGDTVLVFRQVASTDFGDTIKSGPGFPILSDPQRQVLVALAEPLFGSETLRDPATNSEIAAKVHLSVDSVKGHLRHLYKVFEIGSDVPQNRKRRKLADEAIRRGAINARDYS